MSHSFPDCYRLRVQGIEVDCYLGVYAHEQVERRPIRIEVDLFVPVSTAAAHDDDLGGTVNYEQVVESVERVVAGRRFKLVESLCSVLADDLARLPGVRGLRVEITKPRPMPRAQAVRVELWRVA
jgi:dihydroneopterin aldolase